MRSVRFWAVSLLIPLLFVAATIAPSPAREALHGHGLFGTDEIYSADNAAFVKWNAMLARFRTQQRDAGDACNASAGVSCGSDEWRDLIERVNALPFRVKLETINATINRHPYVASMRNWGESNRWETPFEFLRKGGQCQDYAIAKYLALRAAGIPADRLRVVVLRDMRLDVDHAVAVVYAQGEALVLDNQSAELMPADSLLHYQPYYSISEQGWWLHRGPHARYAAVKHGAVN